MKKLLMQVRKSPGSKKSAAALALDLRTPSGRLLKF